ncbi:gliding motility-associated C-terminal domain-containing protein [Flavobacterium sp.]|uniref:gliding motility-associated C-terminal domain-containing protein n=1 Tax=Flavobacterium sp. TaxID=239 RepID=UPI00286D1735|nr:gliding motility-associated C-terminal domain-containing protein [Flavobacterium sp.]
MKKIYLFCFLTLSIFSYGQIFGEFASGIRINNTIYNTSGISPNLINSDPGALTFDGVSLGVYGQNSSCGEITAGEIKTFKNASANVCSATINWRVYLASGSPSGIFNTISLNTVTNCNTGTSVFNDGLGACANGDQKWKDYGLNIDFVNSLLPENYILEIYYSFTGSDVSTSTCETTKYISNSGANFKASFTISKPTTSPSASSTSICEGDSLTLTSNPSGGVLPYTFSWTGPNGYTSTDENPVITNTTISNSGTYSVIATDACGVVTVTQSTAAVLVNPKIDPEFDATLPAICRNGIAPLLSTTSTNGITGTWNPPIVSNTTTTTYLFTPTAGQCANTLSFTIFVVNNVTPVFTLPNSICSGATPPVLSNIANNGIVGFWSPSTVSNTATGTYNFTPSTLQCATAFSKTIVVNPLVAIFLPAIPPICSGDALAALPTTSTNGITGTWSPAVNNTATTTYTFTPTSGQCATATVNLTIVVNQFLATFNAVPAICSGDSLAALPTTSTNGITGTWSPAVNNTATTTYTFTPTSGQCATASTSLTVVVNPVITPTFTPIVSICAGTTSPILPLTSNNGYAGTWNPSVVSNTNSGVYVFTPDPVPSLCLLTTSLQIIVNPLVAIFNPVPAICSGDSLAALPTTSTNGVTGSWSPPLNNTNTTTYMFTPDGGQCATTATLTITVNPKITPTFTAVASICSGSTRPVLPLISNNLIAGSWNPATVSNTASATYTFTPNVGQCGTTTTLIITVNTSPTDILFATTNVINQGPDGIIEILSVTSGVSPYLYSINNSGFTSNKIFTNLLPGNYTITVRDVNGCEFNKIVTIDSDCVFPNAISPNRDSFNDTFDLNGCKINKLEIFNRYGRKVNSYIDYKDQWDGINSNGEELPDGTYFYVAEIEGGTVKTGWVFIAR